MELPKLPEQPEDTDLWRWMQFLNADREEVMTMLSNKNPYIEKAVGVLKELSQDEQVRFREEAREKERRDNASRMKGAFKEGRQEGAEVKQREIVKNMLTNNMPVSDVEKYTGISKSEIENIRREMGV